MDARTGGEPMELRVVRRWREALDVAGLELAPPDAAALPRFEPGAHIDVETPVGWRSYSLCNVPEQTDRFVIFVQREGAGSAALHDRAAVGERLRVRGPLQAFTLSRSAVHTVLVAGGLGITPLFGMAHALWRRGASFDLLYSCRNAERAPLRERLRASPFAAAVRFHWSESAGHLDLRAALRARPVASAVHVCGPAGLVQAAVAAQRDLGRDAARLHLQAF